MYQVLLSSNSLVASRLLLGGDKMATGGGVSDDVIASFKEFCKLAGSKDAGHMTSKANGKLVADCFDKKYKKYDVKAICDASVFPACKEKGAAHMVVNKANVEKYLTKTAHEIAKKKEKNAKLDVGDEAVMAMKADLCDLVASGGPNVKIVKESATGNVSGLTDAKCYTGSHKERFDAETGKGKGKTGREEEADTSGYVGNYKGAGTYEEKK